MKKEWNKVLEVVLILLLALDIFYTGRLLQLKKDQEKINQYVDFIEENYIKI